MPQQTEKSMTNAEPQHLWTAAAQCRGPGDPRHRRSQRRARGVDLGVAGLRPERDGRSHLNRMFDCLERDHLAIAFTLLIRVAYREEGLKSIIENGGGSGGGASVH